LRLNLGAFAWHWYCIYLHCTNIQHKLILWWRVQGGRTWI
jgi:hypothetical protein